MLTPEHTRELNESGIKLAVGTDIPNNMSANTPCIDAPTTFEKAVPSNETPAMLDQAGKETSKERLWAKAAAHPTETRHGILDKEHRTSSLSPDKTE